MKNHNSAKMKRINVSRDTVRILTFQDPAELRHVRGGGVENSVETGPSCNKE
jgi:hypothetical protein